MKNLQSKIEKSILENIPKIKKRGWVFSLIWKVFKISKVQDISEIWTIYRSLKSNNFEIPKTINISHKIELKPNNFQKTYFKKACGIARFTWNWALGNWNEKYKNGEKPSGMSLKKEFNSLKKEHFPFTYEVTKYASQQPFLELQKAFQGFFQKKNGYPKFKKKGKAKDSFYIGGDQIKIVGKKVKIPKLGTVRLRENLRFNGKILNATISRIADKWFISFGVEASLSYLPCKNQASVGIDLGIKTLATLSNGTFIKSPKPLKKNLRKLKKVSRQLSRKVHSRKKGDKTPQSNNYKKHSLKLAKIHKRIANIRKDSLHKLTTYLTDNFQYISIENLNVRGMMANRKLSQAISDLGFFEFKRQLEYKSKLKGNFLNIIDKLQSLENYLMTILNEICF